MRISDWSSDVCSSDLDQDALIAAVAKANRNSVVVLETGGPVLMPWLDKVPAVIEAWYPGQRGGEAIANILFGAVNPRSEEHTSELKSLMRISYAVVCLKKKKHITRTSRNEKYTHC